MDMELKKQELKFTNKLSSGSAQTVVDTDIIVPDTKPDIDSVLGVDALLTVNEKYIQKDHITVSGNLIYTILYLGDEGEGGKRVKSINSTAAYSHQIDVKNIDESAFSDVKAEIMRIDSRVENSRKLNIKTALDIKCDVVENAVCDVVCDIESDRDIPRKTKNIKTYSMSLVKESELNVGDALSVPVGNPMIADILKVSVNINAGDNKVVNDKVVSKAVADITTMYEGDSGEICTMEHEIAFTEVFDIEGINADMHSETEYRIKNIDYKIMQDDDGDSTMMDLNLKLSAVNRAFEEKYTEAISDLYSPDYELDITKENISVSELVLANTSQCVIKNSIELPSGSPQMSKIYSVTGKPYIKSINVSDSKINIDGEIIANILYMTSGEDSRASGFEKSIPFSHKVDIASDEKNIEAEVRVCIDHTNYSFGSGSDAEVRFVLSADAKAFKRKNESVITDVELDKDKAINKKGEPSIVIYFVQKGDTLWDIAKRYHTTVREIADINKIDEDAPLTVGKQLLIPKRK